MSRYIKGLSELLARDWGLALINWREYKAVYLRQRGHVALARPCLGWEDFLSVASWPVS